MKIGMARNEHFLKINFSDDFYIILHPLEIVEDEKHFHAF